MTGPGQVRCHLLWESDDSWDLEQSLFSLVGQAGPRVVVAVHGPEARRPRIEEACARLAPLSTAVSLSVAAPDTPLTTAADDALAIWIAGTLGTPDHFSRALDLLRTGVTVAVAGARRMRLSRGEGEPPYVAQKTWRWTPRHPTLASLSDDPAFLGRCTVRPGAVPTGLPLDRSAELGWGRQLWAGPHPVRIEGFPSIDLPDLRPDGSTSRLHDRWAELRYQLPRRLERAAPLTFARARSWFHAARSVSGGGRG